MKKGFTLIELLAVIVILAIIALIATPIVLDIINDSKENAFKSSIDSIERAIELKISKEQLELETKYPKTIDIKELNIKNKENLKGNVTLYKTNDGYEYTYNITDNSNTASGKKGSEIKNNYPILTLKTEYGIIDDINNYVYSFIFPKEADQINYSNIILEDYFDVENGIIETEPNEIYGNFSTGSKIILKDNNGNVVKEYIVIIFGDYNGDSWMDGGDISSLAGYIMSNENFTDIEKFSFDLNNDNIIDELDLKILGDINSCVCEYNQVTRKCIPLN